MKLETLQSEISDIIQDSEYSDEYITDLINEAVSVVARGVEVPGELGFTAPLPDLYTESDLVLDSSTRYVSMPSGFQRGLVNVYSSSGIGKVPIMSSFRKFIAKFPVLKTGSSIEACVLHGSNLFYHPATDETVAVSYYAAPTELVDFDDEPTCIPGHLHRRLIVSYACKEIFNRIEDGMEGAKVNTEHYNADFFEAVMALDRFIGDDGIPQYIADEDDFIL